MRQGFGLDIPETLEDVCDPRRLALVVYDMQVGLLSQLECGSAVTEKAAAVLDAARAGGYPVFFLRHMFLPNRLKGVFQLRMATAWQQVDKPEDVHPFLLRDSPEFQLAPEMQPRADEAVFDKTTMSAFEGTPLAASLRDLGITAFAIVGVALEVGIEPTVRHGTDLGFIPVVICDAVGGKDDPAQRRSFEGFEFEGSPIVTDTASITPLLKAGR